MKVEEAIRKLKTYSHFKDNWDQQGAKAPSPESIHHAISFILNREDDPYIVGVNQAGYALVEYIQKNEIDSDNFVFYENGKYLYSVIERKTAKFKEI